MWQLIDKIQLFLQNIFIALKFAAFDYDVTLRRTKTNNQRIAIWASIIIATLVIGYLFLLLLGSLFKSIMSSRLLMINQ